MPDGASWCKDLIAGPFGVVTAGCPGTSAAVAEPGTGGGTGPEYAVKSPPNCERQARATPGTASSLRISSTLFGARTYFADAENTNAVFQAAGALSLPSWMSPQLSSADRYCEGA